MHALREFVERLSSASQQPDLERPVSIEPPQPIGDLEGGFDEPAADLRIEVYERAKPLLMQLHVQLADFARAGSLPLGHDGAAQPFESKCSVFALDELVLLELRAPLQSSFEALAPQPGFGHERLLRVDPDQDLLWIESLFTKQPFVDMERSGIALVETLARLISTLCRTTHRCRQIIYERQNLDLPTSSLQLLRELDRETERSHREDSDPFTHRFDDRFRRLLIDQLLADRRVNEVRAWIDLNLKVSGLNSNRALILLEQTKQLLNELHGVSSFFLM